MAESPREILRRIRGIKSTQQITKAMEMVSAVKLAKIRLQAEGSRPYVNNMNTMMRSLCSFAEDIEHPFFDNREIKKILFVIVTSDRGLCGTFNTNIINSANSFIKENSEKEVSLITIGRKGNDVLSNTNLTIEKSFDVPWGDTIADKLKNLSDYLTESFQTERIDAIYLLYSQFKNVLKHIPTVLQYLPVPLLEEKEKKELLNQSVDFIIEPTFQDVAQHLIPIYLETQLYHCVIESLASENAARMVSMRNANDNAKEVINELNLRYNKARQATITRELIDIIGGVEALNG